MGKTIGLILENHIKNTDFAVARGLMQVKKEINSNLKSKINTQ
jgi:hypothetical protein